MTTQNTVYTLFDFYNVMVPEFINTAKKHLSGMKKEWAKLQKSNTKLNNLDNKTNIWQKEANYHTSSRTSKDILASIPMNNLLSPEYKLLTDRTLNQLYETAINNLLEQKNEIIQYVSDNIFPQNMGQFIAYLVLSHPTVCEFMEPIVSELESQARRSIEHLDKQPVIEQKTEPWFAARKNTISASVCGYIDSKACGCDISKETNQIQEKTGLIPRKPFSWDQMPLRRGQQFEDMTRAFYESVHQVIAKEYGLIIDNQIPHIAASPDGVVVNVPGQSDANYLRRRLLGRMLEIKNPYSAVISHVCEPYYYWQTLQQMKVCQLPMCDFVKTRFRLRAGYNERRPRTALPWDEFLYDAFDLDDFRTRIQTWGDLPQFLSPVVYKNLRWHTLQTLLGDHQTHGQINLAEFPSVAVRVFADNFNEVSPCVAENLTSQDPQGQFEARGSRPALNNTNRAMPKGFLWCWNKPDPFNPKMITDEFRVHFTLPSNPVTPSDTAAEFSKHDDINRADGYILTECFMWNLTEYQNIELEYNQPLYEGLAAEEQSEPQNCILNRLNQKWQIIQELLAIPDLDMRWRKYANYYPDDKTIPDYIFDEPEEPTNANDWDLD